MSDSENSSYENNAREASDESDDVVEESNTSITSDIVTNAHKGRNRRVIIDSEDDDSEGEVERRALSPATRLSITGVRPSDMNESSEIGTSDDERSSLRRSRRKISNASVESGSYQSAEGEASGSNDVATPSDTSVVVDETPRESLDNVSQSRLRARRLSPRMQSIPIVTTTESSPPQTTSSVTPSRYKIESPFIQRYSTQFESDLSDKLSSTIYHPHKTTNKSANSSGSSDLEVISITNATIEIDSSDDDSIGRKKTGLTFRRPLSPITATEFSTKTLSQPKITAAMSASSTMEVPKLRLQGPKLTQYVSKEFYEAEVKKLDAFKLEYRSAEKLLDMVHSLPDGGDRLRLRLQRLSTDIEAKEIYIRSLCIEDETNPQGAKQESNRKPVHVPDWDELSAAVSKIQPVHTGKQGMATFNNQKVLTVDRLKDMHGSLKTRPDESVLADDPPGIRVRLMAHQQHALAWMTWRESQKPRGGILADDMGLGKTLTMIALLLAAKTRAKDADESEDTEDEESKENHGWSSKGRRDYCQGGTLVVCPASLLRQWESEVETKISRHKLSVCVHHGMNRETKPKHLRTYDIVVTTYQIIAREHNSKGATFGVNWRRIILDEAHLIRNHKAKLSMAACELKGKYRWALTGTPIQNKEMDVFALMKFLRCTPFDDLSHWKRWIDKSAGGQQRLNTVMTTLMLRRTKLQLQETGELLCLPSKRIELVEIELDKEEMNVYQKIMIYSRSLFAQFLYQRAERESGNKGVMIGPNYNDPNGAYYKIHQKFSKIHRDHGREEIKSHQILVLLLRLRQICCHPGLIDAMLEDDENTSQLENSYSDQEVDLLDHLNKLAISDKANSSGPGNESAELRPEEELMAKAASKVLQRSNPVFDLNRPSSKMLKVLDTLERYVLNTNDKAIIVSQWTSVLNIINTHLKEKGVGTLSLNGTVPVKDRQGIVTEFNKANSNKRVMLLSLTAGGVGLNLVGANHLFLIDLHWNPQLEAQAQDRIFRVGQKKDVVIYKFVCKDTVEERIKALQEHKLGIADGVLTGAKSNQGSKLTMDDLKNLFGM